MARFNDAWMAALLSKSDIVSLVSEYVPLKAKGRKLWGLCPFHTEKTPSFSVSEDRQMYHCFGCGAGGGIVQFVMDMERLPYMEAIQFLAQRAGLELPEEGDDETIQRERARRERLYAACTAAAKFFFEQLIGPSGAEARQYLAKRGVNADVVKRFGLGYAPDSWDILRNFLQSQGMQEVDMVDAGLLVRNAKTGNVYDAYRNRVIFPIIGTNSRVLGFGARTMGDDLPKYINTGDTPIYSKRRNLYALNLLKRIKCTEAVIVEGYMDVISLHAAGIENVVASLGTSLTEQQARLLKRYVSGVFIAYDGDSAGQNATLRGLDILSKEGLSVRVIQMPTGADPDDFVRRHGKEAFENLKDRAMALNAFKLRRMGDAYDISAEDGRQAYAVEGCRFISTLQPVEQERYYEELSRKTGISVSTLRAQGGIGGIDSSPRVTRAVRRAGAGARKEADLTQRERLELMLLGVLANTSEATPCFEECILSLDRLFPDEILCHFAQGVLGAYAEGVAPDVPLLLSTLPPLQAQVIAGAFDMCMQEDAVSFTKDCMRRIQFLDAEEERRKLREMASADITTLEEKLSIVQRLNELDALQRKLK